MCVTLRLLSRLFGGEEGGREKLLLKDGELRSRCGSWKVFVLEKMKELPSAVEVE